MSEISVLLLKHVRNNLSALTSEKIVWSNFYSHMVLYYTSWDHDIQEVIY